MKCHRIEKAFSYIHFGQLVEEMVKEASFGLANLAVEDALRDGVLKTCTGHVHIRQNRGPCLCIKFGS